MVLKLVAGKQNSIHRSLLLVIMLHELPIYCEKNNEKSQVHGFRSCCFLRILQLKQKVRGWDALTSSRAPTEVL